MSHCPHRHRCPWAGTWGALLVLLLVALLPSSRAEASEGDGGLDSVPPFADDEGWRWELAGHVGMGPFIEPERSSVRLGLEAASVSIGLRHRRRRSRSFKRAIGSVFIGDERGLELTSQLLLDDGAPWLTLTVEPTLQVTPVARGRGSRLRTPAVLDVYLPAVGVAYRSDGGLTPVFGFSVPLSLRVREHLAIDLKPGLIVVPVGGADDMLFVTVSVGARLLGEARRRR